MRKRNSRSPTQPLPSNTGFFKSAGAADSSSSLGKPLRQQKTTTTSLSSKIQLHLMLNTVARGVTLACFATVLCFILFFGFNKSPFRKFAGNFFDDAKNGTPVTFLAIPVLLAGTVCSLLALSHPEGAGMERRRSISAAAAALPHQLPRRFQLMYHTLRNVTLRGGDVNFDFVSFVFILIPLLVYICAAIHGKLSDIAADTKESHHTKSYLTMKVSNTFGVAAFFALSVFLIPVARHSAVLSAMGWNPASAVRLHIWAGRIIVVCVCVHGLLYLYRWQGLDGESALSLLIPPGPCWTLDWDNLDFEPTCNNEESDCSCEDHFRNLTGFAAAVALLVILFTSLNSVRRGFYTLFYRVHIMAGPIALLMIVLHYKRSMMYIGGGVLYYLASTIPVLMENRLRARRDGGVRLIAVEHIPGQAASSGQNARPCVSLTLEASHTAVTRYRAGQYIKLFAPSISPISHPFTINTVVGEADQLRVIFRAMGPFTTKLADAMLNSDQIPVCISLEGFHGSLHRTQQVLQHDTVVVVAGGIGITPYLSLLDRVHTILCSNGFATTKKVVLHWLCRDARLIDYVMKNYFDPLLEQTGATGFQINIVIHRTSNDSSLAGVSSFSDAEPNGSHAENGNGTSGRTRNGTQADTTETEIVPVQSGGVPFHPSRFVAASKNSYRGNIPIFFTFASISWIGLWSAWYCTQHFNVSDHVFLRIWSPLVALGIALAIALIANVAYRFLLGDEDEACTPVWTAVGHHEQDDDEGVSIEMAHRNDFSSSSTENGNGVNGSNGSTSSSGPRVNSTELPVVSLEENQGRPAISHLIRSLEQAKHPGLFSCGPPELLDELDRAIGQQARRVAIYKETFHI